MSTINTGTSSPGAPLDAAGLRDFRKALGFSTPRVIYVTIDGSDTTGDGSFAAPYESPQKAFAAWLELNSAGRIHFGWGTFGNLLIVADMSNRLSLTGEGAGVSFIGAIIAEGGQGQGDGGNGSPAPVVLLTSDGTVTIAALSLSGGNGSDSTTSSVGNGGDITGSLIEGLRCSGVITMTGGNGGNTSGADVGGQGGSITGVSVFRCISENLSLQQGSGGGGNMGSGSDGSVVNTLTVHNILLSEFIPV